LPLKTNLFSIKPAIGASGFPFKAIYKEFRKISKYFQCFFTIITYFGSLITTIKSLLMMLKQKENKKQLSKTGTAIFIFAMIILAMEKGYEFGQWLKVH